MYNISLCTHRCQTIENKKGGCMNKIDKMTKYEGLSHLIPCYDELEKRGFKENTWHGETGMNRNFWSKDELYITWVFVFPDRVYMYKEYECGGMVYEDTEYFNSHESSWATIENAFEYFSFE